jgi:hypothetical protein
VLFWGGRFFSPSVLFLFPYLCIVDRLVDIANTSKEKKFEIEIETKVMLGAYAFLT